MLDDLKNVHHLLNEYLQDFLLHQYQVQHLIEHRVLMDMYYLLLIMYHHLIEMNEPIENEELFHLMMEDNQYSGKR